MAVKKSFKERFRLKRCRLTSSSHVRKDKFKKVSQSGKNSEVKSENSRNVFGCKLIFWKGTNVSTEHQSEIFAQFLKKFRHFSKDLQRSCFPVMFVWTLELNFEQTSIIFVAKGHEKGIGVFFSTKYFAPGCFLEHIENSLE